MHCERKILYKLEPIMSPSAISFLIVALTFLASCGSSESETSKIFSGEDLRSFNAVPDSCFTPRERGDRCSFYRECVEASISCEGTSYPYAISYGEKYCNRFQDINPRMSDKGQKWLDSTMVCLQEGLRLWNGSYVTDHHYNRNILETPGKDGRPSSVFTSVVGSCKEVREIEFGIHPECYLGGPSRFSRVKHPSICELGVVDTALIVTRVDVKDSVTPEAFNQMIQVANVCIPIYASKVGSFGATFGGLSLTAVSDNQKLYDLWTWKKTAWGNNLRGIPEPPAPASIADIVYGVPPAPAIPAGPGTSAQIDLNRASRSITATKNGTIFQVHANEDIFRYDGSPFWRQIAPPDRNFYLIGGGNNLVIVSRSREQNGPSKIFQLTDSGEWLLLDNNPATWSVGAYGNRLIQTHRSGIIWEYTGVPLTGWVQLDNNPKTKSVAMNESELFQIHNDGAIWRYTGTPFVGWELLDSNPSTANIVAGGSKLYQQHKNGDIWEWQGGRNWTKIYTHVVPPGMGGYPEI